MSENEHVILVHGQPLDYIEFGVGLRPLVLISGISLGGLCGLGDVIASACAQYAARYHVYVFDRIRELPVGYTVENMAEDIAEALEKLGIRNADMMGSSQGGMILQCLAIDHPELVRAAVISSSSCMPNPVSNACFILWREIAKSRDPLATAEIFFRSIYSDRFRERNAAALATLANTVTPEQCDRFAVLAEACRVFDSSKRLHLIRCPVLVIGVNDDRVLSGEASRILSELIGCELYMYEGFSHPVCDEAPDYQQRLLDFFSGV